MDIGLASYASEVLLPDGCIIETKLDCKQRFTVTYTDKLKNSRSLLGKASAWKWSSLLLYAVLLVEKLYIILSPNDTI